MKRILGSLVVLAAVLVGPAAQGVQAAIPAVVTQSPQTVALQPAADVLATNVVAVRNGSIAKSGALWPYVDDGTSFASADDGATLVRSAARVASAAHETSYAYLLLLGGLENLSHLRPVADLWDLAQAIRRRPRDRASFLATPVPELVAALQRGDGLPFAAELRAYLQRTACNAPRPA